MAAEVVEPAPALSGFEELIASVPAVLDALPEESRRAVAATSWAALLSTLEHTPFALNVSAEALGEGKAAVVRGLAERLERRDVPVPGSVRLESITRNHYNKMVTCVHVEVPADDAATICECDEGLRDAPSLDDVLDGLKQQVVRSETSGAAVRMRAISVIVRSGRARNAERRDALAWLLGRAATQRHLRTLRVIGIDFAGTSGDLTQVLSGMTNLECLLLEELGDSRCTCSDICGAVRGLRSLRTLSLTCADQTDEADARPVAEVMQLLASNKCIEELRLRGFERILDGDAPAIEEMLRSNTTLRKLELLSFSDERACMGVGAAIGAALESNRTLTHLSLRGRNLLKGEGAVALMTGIGEQSTLRELVLNDAGLQGEALVQLGRAVAAGSVLSRVDFVYNNNMGAGVSAFAQAVTVKSCIESLTLHMCGVDDDGTRELAKAIKHGALGRTLRELDLGYNTDVTGEGVAALAEALHGNATLRELRLTGSSAGDRGAAALASALQCGCAMKRLDLRCCGISDEGATALAGALRTNATLRALDACYNGIGRADGAALADALGPGSALHELHIGGNGPITTSPMDDSTAQAFVRAVRRGAAVRVFDCRFWDKVASERTRGALAALGCRRAPNPFEILDVP